MPTAAVSPSPYEPASSPFASSGTREGDLSPLAAHRLRELNALLDRTSSELERLYNAARAPRLGDVAGDLRGRMLAWPSLQDRPNVAGAIRAFAGSKAFPWRGKSFQPKGEISGEGINRVISDRLRLFRFETFIGPSKAGDFDALQLDYDLASNPGIIRRIKDEIRELEPGLWLGQAYLKTRTRNILWLYFALARVDA
jgi:hypothetical protein